MYKYSMLFSLYNIYVYYPIYLDLYKWQFVYNTFFSGFTEEETLKQFSWSKKSVSLSIPNKGFYQIHCVVKLVKIWGSHFSLVITIYNLTRNRKVYALNI